MYLCSRGYNYQVLCPRVEELILLEVVQLQSKRDNNDFCALTGRCGCRGDLSDDVRVADFLPQLDMAISCHGLFRSELYIAPDATSRKPEKSIISAPTLDHAIITCNDMRLGLIREFCALCSKPQPPYGDNVELSVFEEVVSLHNATRR